MAARSLLTGFERVKGPDGSEKFYLIGGGGGPAGTRNAYSMWAFSSDKIDGPYSPVSPRSLLASGLHSSKSANNNRADR